MLRFLLRLLVVVPILVLSTSFVASYTILPRFLEERLERDLQRRLGLSVRPEVDLQSDPPPEMLFGEFSKGEAILREPRLGSLRPERVIVELDPFELDVRRSLRSGMFVSREPLSGDFLARITEGEVERMIRSGARGVPIGELSLRRGRVEIESYVRILGAEVPVSMEGDPELRNENISFEPRSLRAAGVRLPRRFSGALLARAQFLYSLGELPYGAEVSGVKTRKDSMILTGQIERIPGA